MSSKSLSMNIDAFQDDFFDMTDKAAYNYAIDLLQDTGNAELLSHKDSSCFHIYGQLLPIGVGSRPHVSYSLTRLGFFQTIQCRLGFESLKRVSLYLCIHSNRPLIFPKGISRDSSAIIRVF